MRGMMILKLRRIAKGKGFTTLVLALMIVATTLMAVGCANSSDLISENEAETVNIASIDGKYEITADSSWVELTGELSADATLEVGNATDNYYLVVISENKVDFDMDLAGYNEVILDMMSSDPNATNPIQYDTVTVKLDNGMDAYKTRLDLTYDGINAVYWIYALETEEEYVQLVGYTLKSVGEENESIIDEVALTFHEAESKE